MSDPAALPARFQKLGLRQWRDIVLHFPLRYENQSQLWTLKEVMPGQFAQVQVRVLGHRVIFRPRRMLIVDVEDDSGIGLLRYIYFKEAQRQTFSPGTKIRVLGEARRSLAGTEFIHPRIRMGWQTPQEMKAQPMLAVYPTTAGLTQISLRRAVDKALEEHLPKEWLPDAFLKRHALMPLPEAILQVHRPPANAETTGLLAKLAAFEGAAWNRIRLDELLAQQLAMRRSRQQRSGQRALACRNMQLTIALEKALPFQLTAAQARVWREISLNLNSDRPMQRLLQGDVGSGKTVIAVLAAAQAVGSGLQVAVMAPTEILATQLFQKFSDGLGPLGRSVMMLKGGMPAAKRRAALAAIASGEVAVVVGTHALIQKGVAFHRLGLVVVDEQHRFGVGQRLALRASASSDPSDLTTAAAPGARDLPHLLGMSATPIPRSLAMTYLADLDVSVLDERPPNRQRVITKLMSAHRREELLLRVKEFIDQGGQAFWVCPVIEQTEEEDEQALQAIDTAEALLRPIFQSSLAVVHGRLPADEKAAVMAAFAAGQKALLLATTVIEVGVDVPKASLMVIEHAERFGLAQLHQLRGRIGRGAEQSTCILLFDEPLSELAKERLRILYETDDGFEIARRDLALRGPGEFLGLKQSGLPTLRYSDFQRDAVWVDLAISFGAELADAAPVPEKLAALGVTPAGLEALVDRWAFGKESFLAGG